MSTLSPPFRLQFPAPPVRGAWRPLHHNYHIGPMGVWPPAHAPPGSAAPCHLQFSAVPPSISSYRRCGLHSDYNWPPRALCILTTTPGGWGGGRPPMPRNTLSGNATSNSVIATISGSFESVKTSFSQLTPIEVCKWSGIVAVATVAAKQAVKLLLSPFFWVYLSWTWMFWPWFLAIAFGAYGIHCFRKFSNGEATVFEQFALVTSTFTWLTLVPPAFVNGYVDGWPVAFFFIYHYFVFFNATVRKRMYGDTCLRPHDPKWDVSVPKLYSSLFCVGVTIGHWLAAFEGPELIRLAAGGWYNGFIWGLILITLFMQYHATFYLAKYSENVVVPSAVVQFGPYRFVRHPLYASNMLLFMTYFAALQAPMSALYMALVCVLYYHQKAELEEAVLLDEFGEAYVEYKKKVPYKLIPYVF